MKIYSSGDHEEIKEFEIPSIELKKKNISLLNKSPGNDSNIDEEGSE